LLGSFLEHRHVVANSVGRFSSVSIGLKSFETFRLFPKLALLSRVLPQRGLNWPHELKRDLNGTLTSGASQTRFAKCRDLPWRACGRRHLRHCARGHAIRT
jgi:hypothetical protein